MRCYRVNPRSCKKCSLWASWQISTNGKSQNVQNSKIIINGNINVVYFEDE